MRWFIFLLLVLAALWYLRGLEEVEPPPIEEGIIGGPVKALHKAQGVEKTYLQDTQEHQKQIEEQLEKDSGG